MRNPDNPRATTYTDTISLFKNNKHLIDEADGWDYQKIKTTSRTVLKWVCRQGHRWESNLGNRVGKNSGCPYCAGKAVLSGFNDLATLDYDISKQWHPTLNGNITPEMVALYSHKKYWWTCSNNHSFEQNIAHMVNYRSCLVCSGKKLVTGINDFKTLYPELANQWDYTKNILRPENIKPKDGRKAWWVCSNESDHVWEARVSDRANGSGCSLCTKTGFRQELDGKFYIIYNKTNGAGKVGITNSGKRLSTFESKGWHTLFLLSSEDGKLIQDLETKMLQWLRKEKNIPIFLNKKDMQRLQGFTETFSYKQMPLKQVVNQANIFYNELTNSVD